MKLTLAVMTKERVCDTEASSQQVNAELGIAAKQTRRPAQNMDICALKWCAAALFACARQFGRFFSPVL
jgi:hypothetical protein